MKSLLVAMAATLSLSSCAQLFFKEKTYEATGGSEINGAQVGSAVKAMGGKAGMQLSAMVYSAATGETDGPFLWRIEARGQEGVHESMTVHNLRVITETTKRNQPFPSEWLGKAVPFEEMKGRKNAGTVFAKFQLPGKLEVFPDKDGEITMEADVSVKAKGRSERKKVQFVMKPRIGRKTDTVFFPTEIISSFGKKDPTEWEWSSTPDPYGDQFWGQEARFW